MGNQQMKFMCMPCSFELQRYTQKELEHESEGKSERGQLAAIPTLLDKVDAHMRAWVSQEDSR
jgi:hypothetical protein